MEKTSCVACGEAFQPAFVFQIAMTADGQRKHFCSLECRQQNLGDEAFRPRRARRIAILNQKGGTGKTTTAVNLAAGLAERTSDVLLIDTDAQGNVGVSLGVAALASSTSVRAPASTAPAARLRTGARLPISDVPQGFSVRA